MAVRSASRREVAILVTQFQDPLTVADDFQLKALLAKALSWSQQGNDLSLLLPSMVKLLAHRDLCVKKVAGEVLVQHSKDSTEVTLLAVNTLVQDTQDSSPMVRGLALRTLSSLQQDSVIEHLQRILHKALADKSAYVRRTAVLAVVKLHQMCSLHDKEDRLINTLYEMIRDPDAVVVVNCLSALDEILKEEGGIVINRAIAGYLLQKCQSFPVWCQIQVVDILKKHIPATEEDMFTMMSAADWCLEHNSCAVVITCMQLFLHFLHSHPHLQLEVFKRAKVALERHMGSGNVEQSFNIINFISRTSVEAVFQFSNSFQFFFCRNKDPHYMKLKKIEFLPQLITEDNGAAILEELGMYCLSESQALSLGAMQAIGLTQQQKPFLSEQCVKKLGDLMQSSSPHITSNLLQVLQSMNLTNVGKSSGWDNVMLSVCQNFDMLVDSPGKAALLCLVGEYFCDSEEAFTVVKECADQFMELGDRDVKLQLLTTTTKMFLAHPFELQGVLGGLFEVAMADKDLDVKSRAVFLYKLLESGMDTAKAVLCGTAS